MYLKMQSNGNKRNICLSTQFAIYSGDASNPTWLINRPLINVTGVKVRDAVIPNTFYVIDQRNNQINLIESLGATNGNITSTVLLPNGNYSIPQLQTTLGNLLTSASQVSNAYTVNYNNFTDILNITSTTPFNFATTGNNKNAYYELGFNNNKLNTPVSNSITGADTVDLSGVKMINLSTNHFGSVAEYSGSNYPILANIPITAPSGGVSTLVDMSMDFLSTKVYSLNNIGWITLDERLRVLEPNNDYQIVLCVESD